MVAQARARTLDLQVPSLTTKGAVTLCRFPCNLSRNVIATQVARNIAQCDIPCNSRKRCETSYRNHCRKWNTVQRCATISISSNFPLRCTLPLRSGPLPVAKCERLCNVSCNLFRSGFTRQVARNIAQCQSALSFHVSHALSKAGCEGVPVMGHLLHSMNRDLLTDRHVTLT